MSDKAKINVAQLSTLEPISSLSQERLEELVSLSSSETLGIGVSLFREGDIDNQTVYLSKGDVQLSSSDGSVNSIITDRSEEAHFPLDDSQPRQLTATAMTLVEIVRIDNSVLDYMMMWDQMAVSETAEQAEKEKQAEMEIAAEDEEQPALSDTLVDDFNKTQVIPPAQAVSSDTQLEGFSKTQVIAPGEAKDIMPGMPKPVAAGDRSWIRKMRHIMAFKAMPPANIKKLLEKMESIKVHAGDIIVNQGEPGDYYYVLTEGKAKVTRIVELATLEAGRSFGEEALLSGSKRNASVSMSTDGLIMRLAKSDFDELLKEPLLHRLSPDEARLQISKGAVWLDVRHAKEFNHSHLPKAINIPLHELRLRLNELKPGIPYICYCSTGRRSSAAAFLLAQSGFKTSVLNGGVKVMSQDLQKNT